MPNFGSCYQETTYEMGSRVGVDKDNIIETISESVTAKLL